MTEVYLRVIEADEVSRVEILEEFIDKTTKKRGFFEKCDIGNHCINTGGIAKTIGMTMGLAKEDIDILYLSGLLHDIGKLYIPEEILYKPTTLTPLELKRVQAHSNLGYIVLKRYFEGKVAEVVLYHHERWDGDGYPQKRKGKEIPLLSRILTVADSYDAMISKRVYKDPLTKEEAVAVLKRDSGSQFDPMIVGELLKKENKIIIL